MKEIFKHLLFSLVILSLVSCGKEDVPVAVNQINDYSIESMIYPSSYVTGGLELDPSTRVDLIYDNKNRVSERTGDFLLTSGIGGYAFKFSENVKTVVEYDNSIATIKTQSLIGDFYVNPCKRTLFFENDRLVKRINDNISPEIVDNDTTLYFYDNTGKINRTKTTTTYKTVDCHLNYDENDNLYQVISIYSDKRGEMLVPKEIITFSDYDDAPNLTKNLIIFNECFYRSLSRNNFRNFLREQYDTKGKLVFFQEISFGLSYDENNYPIY